MQKPQAYLPVYMYTSVKLKNLENQGIPGVIRPVIRWVWAKIMEYTALKGVSTPLKGLIGTGIHETNDDIPKVQISIFDGADIKISTLTVFPQIDDFVLELGEGQEWGHGRIEELKIGFLVPLDV